MSLNYSSSTFLRQHGITLEHSAQLTAHPKPSYILAIASQTVLNPNFIANALIASIIGVNKGIASHRAAPSHTITLQRTTSHRTTSRRTLPVSFLLLTHIHYRILSAFYCGFAFSGAIIHQFLVASAWLGCTSALTSSSLFCVPELHHPILTLYTATGL